MLLLSSKKTRVLGAVIVAVLLLAGVLLLLPQFRHFIGIRAHAPSLGPAVIGGRLPAHALKQGENILEFAARTRDGQTITDKVTFTVQSSGIAAGVVTIPDDSSPWLACHTTSVQENVGACINALVEDKDPEQALEIVLAAGTFKLDKGAQTIFIYNRDHITIRGAGQEQTRIVFQDAPTPGKRVDVDRFFLFNLIDASNITLSDLTLDGAGAPSQRGIGACPTTGQTMANLAVRNVRLTGISSSASMWGNSHTFYLQQEEPRVSVNEGPQRLRMYLLTKPVSERICAGSFDTIMFENNVVDISTSVSAEATGFYLTPEGHVATANETITPENWRTLNESTARKTIGLVIRGNTFTAQSDQAFNGLKIHSAYGALIENNVFDAQDFLKAFDHGAAINLAGSIHSVIVRNNTIRFPANHRSPRSGISIKSAFTTHNRFGLGNLLLTTPAIDPVIENNTFINSAIAVADCCYANEERDGGVTQDQVRPFCQDADANPETIYLRDNTQNGVAAAAATLLNYFSQYSSHPVIQTNSCRVNLPIQETP